MSGEITCGITSPARVTTTSSPSRTSLRARSSSLRSEEHTSELQSQSNLVCRLLLEKKNKATPAPSRVVHHIHVLAWRLVQYQLGEHPDRRHRDARPAPAPHSAPTRHPRTSSPDSAC